MNEISRASFLKAYQLGCYFLVIIGITSFAIILIKYIEMGGCGVVLQRMVMFLKLRPPLIIPFGLIIFGIPYWLLSTICIFFLEKDPLKYKDFKIGLVGMLICILVFFF